VLVVVALVAGGGLAVVLAAFPLPVLAALLLVAAVAHARLLRDVRGAAAWTVVVGVGVVGGLVHLGAAVVGGLLVSAVLARLRRRGANRAG
jgi:hypothetical protein